MATSLPWSVKGVDPRTRDAAKAAARRAGMTLGEWLDNKIRDEAESDAAPPPQTEQLDIAALSERLARLSQGEMQTASTPTPAPTPIPKAAPELSRERIDAFITQAAMAERLTRDTGTKTAGALDSIAKWIEKTESRLSMGERATAERQERATNVIADAIKTMGERIAEIERKTAEASRKAAAPTPPPAAQNRPFLSRDGLAAAVSDIRSRQRTLDGEPDAPVTHERGIHDRGNAAQTLAGLREDLRNLSARIAPAQPVVSPAVRIEEQRAAFQPLERAIGDLGSRLERLDGRDRLDPVLKPLARIEAEIARISDNRSQDGLSRFELEIAHLAAKVDALVARGGDRAAIAPVLREIAELRDLMAAGSDGRRLDDLSQQLSSLSSEIGRLRDAQPDGRELRNLSLAIEDVRDSLLSDRSRERSGDNAPLLALSRQVESLAQKIETLPSMKASVIDSQVNQLIARLDELDAMGRPASNELSGRIEALVIRLESLADRSANPLDERIDVLQQQLETIARQGPSNVEKQIEALAGRIDALAASSNLSRIVDDGGVPVAQVDMRPVEDMLRQLAGKIDEAGRPGAGADSFDALEQQIAGLAHRLDEAAATRSAETGIERTLQDLVVHLQSMREDTAAAAERAARAAMADMAPPRGAGFAELSSLVTGLRDTHASSGRQTQDAIGAVHQTLETVIARLASLEAELGSERGQGGRSTPPLPPRARTIETATLPPATQLGAKVEERLVASRGPAAAFDVPLEPGSGRPRVETASAPGDQQSVRQSLIAAARRSAKAASEAASAAPVVAPEPAKPGKAAPTGGRLKEIMEKRRRPLLLGLAAVILAMGAAHVLSGPPAGDTKKHVANASAQITPPPATAEKDSVETTASAAPNKDQNAILAPMQLGTTQALAAPQASLAQQPEASVAPAPMVAALPPATAAEPPESVTGLNELPATLGTSGMRKAAQSGDARAVYELAALAVDKPGAGRDPKLALHLFERAAVAGLAPAQFRLGNMFEKGIGTNRDISLARLWYSRAAERGNAKAMHNLAVLYAEGANGKPDYGTATEWFRRAAEFGVRDSQYNLAVLLGRGLGAPADLGLSYRWFAIAAAQGDEDAGRKRDEVAGRLSAADLATAKSAVEVWKPKPLEALANEVAAPAKGWEDSPAAAARKPAKPTRG
ncbi:hypothetical protein DK26_02580 [Bosea sp. WAO]|uniref:SEL1-like repeat protein n=1 Tax=Bosea sp. WAO TaxID=406341 RepID=UPI000749929B|nr:SEL1-like repeat protein [Bosea sp. WAO]KUL96892.1 hypothetical protein DK26_02580 [Bosea sp. WAO]